jgi:hypothetical protein
VAVDLPHYPHHHLKSCWQKHLGLETVKWMTVAKVGGANLRSLCLQMRNISPRRCPKPSRFLVFDSETAN